MGVVHRFVLRSECEYLTSAGPVRVERNLYADRSGGGRALCPLERRAGVIRGYWTPRAAQLATWVTAHLVPGEAEQLFGRLGGMTPSRSTLDRLPKELSERWERQRAEFEQSLRLTEEVPQEAVIVAVSLDGVMVPMKAGQRKEKRAAAAAAGKPTRGPAGYCEAACATVTVYDHERAPLHTVRMGRMPESKKAPIKGMLCDELAAVVAARPELEIVAVADGARDNWRYFDRELPGAAQIADFYHAVEHLGVALASAYGEGSTRHKSQFKKLRYVLEYEAGGIDKVIRSLRHLRDRFPRRKALRRGSEVLPTQPAPDALPGVHRTGLAHRLRNGRSRLQDPCDTAAQAVGDAVEHRWRTSDPDFPLGSPEPAIRPRVESGRIGLPDRCDPGRQRLPFPAAKGRLMRVNLGPTPK